MSSSRLCLAFLFISSLQVLLSACPWINDLLVKVTDIKKTRFGTTNGCIERTSFDGKIVEHLSITDQSIGNLGEDSAKDLIQLKTLVFLRCKIISVSPGAFRNLPRIRKIMLSHGNITEIPLYVFNVLPSLQSLDIGHNEIELIEDQAFANLSSLNKIYAEYNKLEYWNRKWFTNNTALKDLHFESNRLRAIPRRAFVNVPKLTELYLEYNDISVIQPEAFLGLTNLDYLGLRYDRLTEIREDIFPNALKIGIFEIDANYLNFLSERLLQKISVREIRMDNNPWKCPCLDRIHFWLHRSNVTKNAQKICIGSNIPVCAVPITYSRVCWEVVDPELTQRYIRSLRDIEPSLEQFCARTDGLVL